MTILNIGRVRLGWTGEWDALIDYTAYDAVTYEGGSYACTTDSAAGILPTNTTYWQVMALKGIVGDTGDAGSNGTNGTDGSTGPQGIQGIAGDTGPQGTQGLTGSQGATGSQGLKGDIGVTGNTGPQGTQGIQGTEGIQGIIGVRGQKVAYGANTNTYITNSTVDPTGDIFFNTDGNVYEITGPNSGNHNNLGAWEAVDGTNGVDGATGATGAAGTNGTDGATGPQGIDGPTGTQGAMGNTGPTGTTGATGTEGPQGSTGLKGDTGAVGSQGVQGIDGPQGPDGPVGDTAYEEAVAAGFAGTESAWLTSLIGDDGPQGSQGIQGSQGLKGDIGTTGAKGDQGVQGTQGIEGDTGPQGTQGIKGDTGTTGAVGDQGIQGTKGNTGNTGSQGPIGNDGPVGLTGADSTVAGPTGPTGPEGSAANVDTANVAAAGALMDSEVDYLTDVKTFNPAAYATSLQGAKADSALQPDGDGSGLSGISSFQPATASGDNQVLDLGNYNFFDAGATFSTTGTTTVSFANIPTSARFEYSYVVTINPSISYTPTTSEMLVSEYEDPLNVFIPYVIVGKPDGTRYYVWDYYGNLRQYDLSTAYDMTTASYAGTYNRDTPPVADTQAGQRGGWFKPDGTKIFFTDGNGNNVPYVYQATMTTPWDVTTITGTGYKRFNLNTWLFNSQGLTFKPDGTLMFVTTNTNNGNSTYLQSILMFTLSTAWDVSTASFTNFKNLTPDAVSQLKHPSFNADGSILFVCKADDFLVSIDVPTPYDVTSITNTEGFMQSSFYKADGITKSSIESVSFWDDGAQIITLPGGNGTGLLHCNYSTAGYNQFSFPASVEGTHPMPLVPGTTVILEYITLDGGTTVDLISATEIT